MLLAVRTQRASSQRPLQTRHRTMGRLTHGCLLAIAVVALLPAGVDGHARSVSYSGWKMDPEGATVRVRVSLLELSRLGIPLPMGSATDQNRRGDATGLYLSEHLNLRSGGFPCVRMGHPQAVPAETGWAVYRWRGGCEN